MILLDSNLIIYAAQPQHAALRRFIRENSPLVSAVSYVEVLGFHKLNETDRAHFAAFFAAATVLPIDQTVIETAMQLRQMRRISLGDSLIAATCLTCNLTLATHNVSDFTWIADLILLDPLANAETETD